MEEGEEIQCQIGKCSRSLKRDQSRAHRLVGAHQPIAGRCASVRPATPGASFPALRRLSREVNIA